MGLLDELGFPEEEEELNPFRHPPSVLGESIPEEAMRDEEELPPLTSLVEPEEDDFMRQLREGKFDTPAFPTHPDELESEQPPSKKKKSTGKRVAYSVSCTLHLCGSDYEVQPLPPSSDYDKAYRLNKIGANKPTGYNIVQIDGEIVCECPDSKYRHEGAESKGCKHIRGLVDMGMFAAPPMSSHKTGTSVFDG